nr:family 10 glycosylhydrolase [Lihuaxuella thermophila]
MQKAHASNPRIEVHAWFAMMPVWNQSTPPKDPNHVFNLHGPGKTGRDLWLSKNFAGSFTGDGNSEYVIDPGHPDAADYTINVLKHVAAHYDVDGIHMDLIRYMGTDWGYNPTSVDRFNQRYGRTGLPDPNDETWKAWRREQVNHLVEKAYANLLAVKPNLVVSAATIAWGNGPKTIDEYKASLTMNSALQDWNRWLETGAIDLAIPMNYFREYDPTQKQYYENWLAWEKDHQYKRRISAGVGLYLNSIPDGLTQIRKARQPSVSGNKLAGVHLYSYAVTNKDGVPNSEFYAALSEPSPYDNQTPVLAEQVAPPVLPWKAQPITGHLTGKVLYSNGTISDNETVTIRGPESRTVQTDGSGDYSAIDLKPGTYTITCGKISKTVSITAGKVTQANLTD